MAVGSGNWKVARFDQRRIARLRNCGAKQGRMARRRFHNGFTSIAQDADNRGHARLHAGAMKTSLCFWLTLCMLGMPWSAGAEDEKKLVESTVRHAIRTKFVPLKKGDPAAKGASGTTLSRKSFDPTALVAMLHIGLGESFPIHDEQGKQRFMLTMTEGDDGHLVFEVKGNGQAQKVAVVLDEPAEITVDGTRYEISYPTTEVSSEAEAVQHQVMLFVKQRG
jgi:hypothetical protein